MLEDMPRTTIRRMQLSLDLQTVFSTRMVNQSCQVSSKVPSIGFLQGYDAKLSRVRVVCTEPVR